jgi:phosphate transport system permease protein
MSAPPHLDPPIFEDDQFAPRLGQRRLYGVIFSIFCILATVIALGVLAALIGRVVMQGWEHLRPSFLTSFVSRKRPETTGIRSGLWGTIWVMGLTTLFSIPLGVGAAVYLHEFSRKNSLTRLIDLNIANLAGVPSIVYGLLGLTLFVRLMNQFAGGVGIPEAANPFGRTVLAASLTMTLMVLPVIIIGAREALVAVPDSIRQASYAMGATRWQTVWHHVLPAATPGILTGVILSLSRAIGEAAPLIVVGAVAFTHEVPSGLGSGFTVLPIQIYDWMGEPQMGIYQPLSAAAIIVLLMILFVMNGVCVFLRAWQTKRLS